LSDNFTNSMGGPPGVPKTEKINGLLSVFVGGQRKKKKAFEIKNSQTREKNRVCRVENKTAHSEKNLSKQLLTGGGDHSYYGPPKNLSEKINPDGTDAEKKRRKIKTSNERTVSLLFFRDCNVNKSLPDGGVHINGGEGKKTKRTNGSLD